MPGTTGPASPSTSTPARPPARRARARTWWNPVTQRGTDAIVIKFAAATCRGCPVRDQCTRSTSTTLGRQLTVPPREVHDAQLAARAAQDTPDWQADYARRAGVEGTIRQAVAVTGMRRARYRGLPKTTLEHVYSAVALNLIRLDAYWNGHRPGPHQNQPPHPSRARPGGLIELASRVIAGANRAPNGRWPATGTGSRCTWSPPAPTITTRRCWSRPWPASWR